ncbi:L-aspartate oxidase [Phorcysia thermohydrogeniphila]|uniref:L-aspartate oxidase n=1 Tax=Phorcysia thermohydrogeniphila TaxID=936138 RepID=A0A4R1GF68_9BACT|nr:L-aspartate oxidase [Phorcysia thermohydrogeniphila]TCK06708.1 L-aspartate oxidase [Phorcysia thermohydrogeniphila]
MKSLLDIDTLDLPSKEYDAVVVGSGAAGLFCAIRLSLVGLKVCVITKSTADAGSTSLAQGGIAAALPMEDSPDLHFSDTVKAGAGLVKTKMARILAEEGVKRIIDLIRMGVRFETDERGLLRFTREAAHSVARVIHYKDKTGEEIERALLQNYSGDLIENAQLKELIVKDNRCYGVIYEKDGKLRAIYAPVVAIATGGAAGLYLKNTNPPTSTGDGIAIALRYGAKLEDLEFVQFHPTAFCDDSDCFLISEAVRGEGAIIVDEHGRRFMGDYHHLWELAPRDVVTRAIETQRRITGGNIYLDFRPIEEKGIDVYERFPTITQKLKEKGLDPKKDLIPITPVAHYYIGGIAVDSFGRTTIKGLFAIGEASCTGVHGANRLASNSLLECIVFGDRAAYGMYRDWSYLRYSFAEVRVKYRRWAPKNSKTFSLEDVKETMWNNVGIVRSAKSLTKAIDRLSEIVNSDSDWIVRNSAILGLAIAISAMRREESRGGHFRSDFPYEREEFRKHSEFTLSDLERLI